MDHNFVEVRCPFKVKSKKTNKVYDCNNLCGKVVPPAIVEMYCTHCKKPFEMEISTQSKSKSSVPVQSTK